MPIYEYRCQDCNHVFEEWHRGYEEKEITCPVCNGLAKRLISNTAFILKGSGWYVTDYARNQSSAGSGNGNGDGKSQEQTASTAQDGEASQQKESSQTAGDTAGGNGSKTKGASGEKSGSGGEGEKTATSRTNPSNSSSTE